MLKYDGTEFHGWQRQPGQRTVQGVLEDALGRILGRSPYVYGAGRTDSGVHALAQVAHFRTDEGPPLDEFRDALRHILPEDLGVVSMVRVKENFHARHHATGKIYRYVIHNNPFPDPFRSRFEALVRAPLHLESMKKAAAFLIGRHDFAAFRSAKATSKTTERNLDRITLIKKGKRIEVEFRAPGFLYHMVRNIMAALIEVGKGRLEPEDVRTLLESKDRHGAPASAPAKGLVMVKVMYGKRKNERGKIENWRTSESREQGDEEQDIEPEA